METGWWSRFWHGYRRWTEEGISNVTGEVAKAMCGGAVAIYKEIGGTFGDIAENRRFVAFMPEALYYFLHLLDRELSKATLINIRTEALDNLLRVLCNHLYKIIYGLGFDVTDKQVFEIFQGQYNQRQIEYGSIGKDWFQRVTAQFGEHATDALEPSEKVRHDVALKCGLLAPTIYGDLSSVLQNFLELARKRSRERII